MNSWKIQEQTHPSRSGSLLVWGAGLCPCDGPIPLVPGPKTVARGPQDGTDLRTKNASLSWSDRFCSLESKLFLNTCKETITSTTPYIHHSPLSSTASTPAHPPKRDRFGSGTWLGRFSRCSVRSLRSMWRKTGTTAVERNREGS